MTALHLVATRVLPDPGGLQESVLRIGQGLKQSGFEVIVYTLNQPANLRFDVPKYHGLTLIHLNPREASVEPLPAVTDPEANDAEENRAMALTLRNAVERQRARTGEAGHLMVSFFASTAGFLAQLVATALNLPHLVSVRGSDFALDIFRARRHSRLRLAIESASLVVTTNQEQADSLSRLFVLRKPVRTIHNALAQPLNREVWKPSPSDTIRLISDCGFGRKKATHILLRAVSQLIDQGLPVSLMILGGVSPIESEADWKQLLQSYESRYPGRFSFPGHVDSERLEACLRSADIYCSATLAEGSSISRIRAMTIGIPMVTTATGGMRELADGCRHVRLCPAGDLEALAGALRTAVLEHRDGTLQPDARFIERWRRHFSVERERADWVEAVESALAEIKRLS
jgi:glycosyltransferase involved in cell wall biosynthesis